MELQAALCVAWCLLGLARSGVIQNEARSYLLEDSFRFGEDFNFPLFKEDDAGKADKLKFRKDVVNYLVKIGADNPAEASEMIKELGTVDHGDMSARELSELLIKYGVGGLKPNAPPNIRKMITIIEKFVPDRKELDFLLKSVKYVDLGPNISAKAAYRGVKIVNDIFNAGLGTTNPKGPAGKFLGFNTKKANSQENEFRQRMIKYMMKKATDTPAEGTAMLKELAAIDTKSKGKSAREVADLMVKYGVGGISEDAPTGIRQGLAILEKYVPDRKELDMMLRALPFLDLGARVSAKEVLKGVTLVNDFNNIAIGVSKPVLTSDLPNGKFAFFEGGAGGSAAGSAGGSAAGGGAELFEGGYDSAFASGAAEFFEGASKGSAAGGGAGFFEGDSERSAAGGGSVGGSAAGGATGFFEGDSERSAVDGGWAGGSAAGGSAGFFEDDSERSAAGGGSAGGSAAGGGAGFFEGDSERSAAGGGAGFFKGSGSFDSDTKSM